MKKSSAGSVPMATSLCNKGVSAYVGWTESQHVSIESANWLFYYLALAKNIKDAFSSLDKKWKEQVNSDGTTAKLMYSPDSAATISIYDVPKDCIIEVAPALKPGYPGIE